MGLMRRFLDSFAGRVLATCAVVLAVLFAASLSLHDRLQSRAAERGTASQYACGRTTPQYSLVKSTHRDAGPSVASRSRAALSASPELSPGEPPRSSKKKDSAFASRSLGGCQTNVE